MRLTFSSPHRLSIAGLLPRVRTGCAGLLLLWLVLATGSRPVLAQDPAAAVALTNTNAPVKVEVEVVAAPAKGSKKDAKKEEDNMRVPPPHFETWPLPPMTAVAPLSTPLLVEPAPTVLSKTVEDQKLYSFHAENLELKMALALFARANHLNIVPDPDVTGNITLDVEDLPLKKILQAILEANDFTWAKDEGLIRVHATQTRLFTVDYLRMVRNGVGHSSATLSSGSSGGGGGGSGSSSVSSSDINLTQQNPVDYWKDLQENLTGLLSPAGKVVINKTGGILQVSDRPSALKRVEGFLKDLGVNSLRQVEIEAKLYDVTLSDQFQFGIDWVQVAAAYGGTMAGGGLTGPQAIGGTALGQNALSGLNSVGLAPSNSIGSVGALMFANKNTQVAVNALKQQGNVEVIAQPRIRTLNNQTALIKVGTETPFFAQTFQSVQTTSGNQTFSGDTITTITVGTILSITPQISEDGWILLDVSPVLTSLVGTETSPDKNSSAPILDTKQASTLVRVRNGATIVLGGLIQTEKSKNQTKVPLLGDIPLLGKLFTSNFDSKVKKELVIFLTPTIVP